MADTGKHSLPVRKRAIIAIFIAFLNFVGLGAWGITTEIKLLLVLAVIVPALAGAYLLSLRCPNCGTRIYKRKAQIFGEEFAYWGGLGVPRECAKCGTKL
ncbi:hypothetical protein FRZ61_12560 [Hypericibacter adhaerens]|jgi:hypothetical protein|uniref:Uncharacterized protein n=1 Tax=Hypericibacter adhaerens TaxID=2602016 RepID=A0A5J6MVL2_9PROT|nr:hypothetical protein FRZ61_12560 [Hypericibacter adhaerens]